MGTIILYRGDSYSEALTVTRDDGSGAFDLTGCMLFFTAKRALTDADADALIRHTSATAAITITNAVGGLATHVIADDETDDLTDSLYHYDYRVLAADGTSATLEVGKLVVQSVVTRALVVP